MRIFVYIFCLTNICSSLSDEANKIEPLNIEPDIPSGFEEILC